VFFFSNRHEISKMPQLHTDTLPRLVRWSLKPQLDELAPCIVRHRQSHGVRTGRKSELP
jgi:hypothetical protein